MFRMSQKIEILKIFKKSLESICPRKLAISKINSYDSSKLFKKIDDSSKLVIVGYGKAAAGMTTVIITQDRKP